LSISANNFGARYRQVFPGSDVEGDPFPAPRIDLEFHRGKCFHLRVFRYAILIAVAAELTTDEISLGQSRNRLQHFDLFVAYRFTVESRRRFHRQIREHLKKMILNHIANGARLIVETSPTLDTKIFRHRDLDALDVVAIPKRLDKRVRKAKDHEVIHRPLSEVVVDAKNVLFGE